MMRLNWFSLSFLLLSLLFGSSLALNWNIIGKEESCMRKLVKKELPLTGSMVVSGQGEDKVALVIKDPLEKHLFEGGKQKETTFEIKPTVDGVYQLCIANTDRGRKTVSFNFENGDTMPTSKTSSQPQLSSEMRSKCFFGSRSHGIRGEQCEASRN